MRFNASIITVRDSQTDEKFEKTIGLIVVYILEYMDCFLQKEINNTRFPKLTKRMHYLKHEEGGAQKVCEVMEKYSKKAAKKAAKKATKKATKKANIAAIKNMITRFQATKEIILEDYTESEYNTAIAELQSESK